MSAAPIALIIYLLLVLDARRAGSKAAGDDQLGLKTIGASLIVAGTGMFATSLQALLHLLLTFTAFWESFKALLPDLLVGGLAIGGVMFFLFPQTNAEEYPKAKRLAAGAVAVPSGILMLATLSMLISTVLEWPSWDSVAGALTSLITALVVFGASTYALAQMSGLDVASGTNTGTGAAAPVAQPAPQAQYPQQQAPAQPQAQPQYPQPQAQPQPQYPQQQAPAQPQYPQPGGGPPRPPGPPNPPGGGGWRPG